MKKRLYTLFMLLTMFFTFVVAQTTKEEVFADINRAGSTYYSYFGGKATLSPAPEGYKPFYISHYGRHGSRYITSDKYYINNIALFQKAKEAKVLTSFGKQILKKMRKAYADAKGKAGELTTLGGLQHEGVAHRMYNNFPNVFENGNFVDARSTQVHRCQVSMQHFCGELHRLNPALKIMQSSRKEDRYFMCNDRDSLKSWPTSKKIKDKAYDKMTSLRGKVKIADKFFNNKNFIAENIKDEARFAQDLYNIYEDMQCVPELKINFDGIFTNEDLFNLWQAENLRWVTNLGMIPGTTPHYQKIYGLIRNMVVWADEVIASGKSGASLRFGHDSYVFPLAYAMQLEGCHDVPKGDYGNLYKHMANFKIIPMAGNVQLIFYRKVGSDDILVKFLLQEEEKHIPVQTDIWPYYHWKDVKNFYLKNTDRKAA